MMIDELLQHQSTTSISCVCTKVRCWQIGSGEFLDFICTFIFCLSIKITSPETFDFHSGCSRSPRFLQVVSEVIRKV
jgi:uncharacterized membrane protein